MFVSGVVRGNGLDHRPEVLSNTESNMWSESAFLGQLYSYIVALWLEPFWSRGPSLYSSVVRVVGYGVIGR